MTGFQVGDRVAWENDEGSTPQGTVVKVASEGVTVTYGSGSKSVRQVFSPDRLIPAIRKNGQGAPR